MALPCSLGTGMGVPRTAVGVEPLEDVEMPASGGLGTDVRVPRIAASCMQPLQHIQAAFLGGLGARTAIVDVIGVPRESVGTEPLEDRPLTAPGGAHASAVVPRAAVGMKPLESTSK